MKNQKQEIVLFKSPEYKLYLEELENGVPRMYALSHIGLTLTDLNVIISKAENLSLYENLQDRKSSFEFTLMQDTLCAERKYIRYVKNEQKKLIEDGPDKIGTTILVNGQENDVFNSVTISQLNDLIKVKEQEHVTSLKMLKDKASMRHMETQSKLVEAKAQVLSESLIKEEQQIQKLEVEFLNNDYPNDNFIDK